MERPTGDAGSLREVCDCLLDVVTRAPAAPRLVRLQAGDLSVEITFDGSPPDGERSVRQVANGGQELANTGEHAVTATMVGVFYHAPAPDSPPFVALGDTVEAGRRIGVIEAMKLMIPVEADRPGQVLRHLVDDGTPVEYGTPLLALQTATHDAGEQS